MKTRLKVLNQPLRIACSLLAVLLWAIALPAQKLQEAVQLSQSGLYEEADEMFERLTANRPSDPAVRLAHAYNLSWMGRQAAAVVAFEAALDRGADLVEAFTGKGYALAWDGKYREARGAFQKVLALDAGHPDARKGLAYTNLWQGNTRAAAEAFEQALAERPRDYDLLLGAGQARLANGDRREAKKAFEEALSVNPGSAEARRLLDVAGQPVPLLDADVWAGLTSLSEDNEQQFGLRGLQLSARLTKDWQAYLKYDNSLGLDILNFARQNQTIPAVSAGAVREWNGSAISNLEYGLRFFPDDQLQQLLSGSHAVFLSADIVLKGGGMLGFGDIDTEWMTYLTLNLPLLSQVRLEPTYYYISPPDSRSPEHRLQLGLQYHLAGGAEVNLYGMAGLTNLQDETGAQQRVYGWAVTGLMPFSDAVWLQAVVREEIGVFYNFTSLSLGLKLRFNRS